MAVSTERLEAAADGVRDAERELDAARRRRDALIRKAEGDFTVREVAAICGISFSLVSRIQSREDKREGIDGRPDGRKSPTPSVGSP